MNRNNRHKSGYDFDLLIKTDPRLTPFIITLDSGKKSIRFDDPNAVKALNTALLLAHYNIKYWQFSDKFLCPAVPGRVDYIHYLNDLLQKKGIEPNTMLDIGTGASLIYPLLGNSVYQWKFVGTDCNKQSLEQAQKIIRKNRLTKKINLRYQNNKEQIFRGIINSDDLFTASICNPPFYGSIDEANKATLQKLTGLSKAQKSKTTQSDTKQKLIRNFGGKENELWYKGGEKAFIHNYLYESSLYKDQVRWFSILVSNKKHIKGIYNSLKKLKATDISTIPMQHGHKITRVVAWTFQ